MPCHFGVHGGYFAPARRCRAQGCFSRALQARLPRHLRRRSKIGRKRVPRWSIGALTEVCGEAASGAGFDGRDLVGRDLVACSRFWARDRVATAVVRGASPFWKSSFVRAANRHGRDHPANLPLSLGVVGRSRRVAEAPECHWFSTSRRSWPLGKGPLSSSRRECQIKIPKRLPFGAS